MRSKLRTSSARMQSEAAFKDKILLCHQLKQSHNWLFYSTLGNITLTLLLISVWTLK